MSAPPATGTRWSKPPALTTVSFAQGRRRTSHRSKKAAWRHKSFDDGTWQGEVRAEFRPASGQVIAHERCCSSGFANADPDQQFKVPGIHRLLIIGVIANTCIKATAHSGGELGHDVTLVRDATASYLADEMHAGLNINLPNYANAIVTTTEIIEAISSASAGSSES